MAFYLMSLPACSVDQRAADALGDEEVFEDGENYNGLREPNPHQAFGNCPHHCAGAHLSRRTVGAILLPMLFERFPHMTLPDPASVRWHGFTARSANSDPSVGIKNMLVNTPSLLQRSIEAQRMRRYLDRASWAYLPRASSDVV
jgi:hypothetical protein